MENKHIVKFWRGKRATYNRMAQNGQLDYWTRYSIIEPDETVTEIFGSSRLISEPTGQLQPVVDIVSSILEIENPINGERYLVGQPANENNPEATYAIYTLSVNDNGEIIEENSKIDPFTRNMSVRVVNKYMKCYQLVEGELVTYDDVDCGTF